MTHNSHRVAQFAQLAMILEVCATPKPGNVDRDHNYPDTHFEHFIASAVSVYPVMKHASMDHKGIGKYIHGAVIESAKWQSGGNTHFGAFVLLVPLVMAGGKLIGIMEESPEILPELKKKTVDLIKNTTTDDSIELYRAFEKACVKVKEAGEFDLNDPSSIETIRERGITLYQLMEISSSYDMIAREWTTDYSLTFKCATDILKKFGNMKINDAVVWTFLEMLAENPDTFIQTKFDHQKAQAVSGEAKNIVQKIENSGFESSRQDIEMFDGHLIQSGVNPGSTADIIIAGLFVALSAGLKF